MAKAQKQVRKTPTKAPANRSTPGARKATEHRFDVLYRQVRDILAAARDRAWHAVNSVMVEAYWEIGRVIVEEEQAGKGRADYGKRVVERLSERLTVEFGKGFDRSNLFHMRAF